jgi:hypothetical protein
MQTLQLEKMGLAPMTETEMQAIDGGSWSDWTAFGILVLGQGAIVAGVLTANPALIWGGAELTAGTIGMMR